ncbi:MAG: hypothetical protein ACKVT0_11030 [Planctomycetaceae bacterium]
MLLKKVRLKCAVTTAVVLSMFSFIYADDARSKDEAIGTIADFQPFMALDSPVSSAGSGTPAESVGEWRVVRPSWLVARIDRGSYSGLSPRNRPAGVGVLAVDVSGDRAIRFSLRDERLIINSILPLGKNVCGITAFKDVERRKQLSLFAWNLDTDQISLVRRWTPIVDPIARQLDLDKVELTWKEGELGLEPSSISILSKADGSTVSIETPFVDYESPSQMTPLWEGNKETRWYAPSNDGTGIVFFRGVREGKPDFGQAFSDNSVLTLIDPTSDGGIRWEHRLQTEIGPGSPVEGCLPIFTPWGYRNEMILQLADLGYHVKPVPVELVRIRLNDGKVVSRSEFIADTGFSFRRWPHCSYDLSRVVYHVEHPKHFHKLAIFSIPDGDFIDELPCPTRHCRKLITVLPSDEAVVVDNTCLWAVGIGTTNLGKVRTITTLFRDE